MLQDNIFLLTAWHSIEASCRPLVDQNSAASTLLCAGLLVKRHTAA